MTTATTKTTTVTVVLAALAAVASAQGSIHISGGGASKSGGLWGKAHSRSVDVGTAFSSKQFQGSSTGDYAGSDAKIDLSASEANGATMASTLNPYGYSSGTSATHATAGFGSGAGYYPDGAGSAGHFDSKALGRASHGMAGQTSDSSVHGNDGNAFSYAGTSQYEYDDWNFGLQRARWAQEALEEEQAQGFTRASEATALGHAMSNKRGFCRPGWKC
ncbi:hypothetical protein HOP50_16g78750 [Chloropicon primus]|uniref:Uncharacterized protein n=1 Tax=Chloropicon primus TaxID=1764295 RepID=A0A5B8MXQ4_9CHLO|nr:hypothetical protein A3770_16p78450 [Chloropicon primus]UPR04533.1 hypothetical protein HOP50_16g78750 [Chloropicon primus]|mmetsp:Transcript_3605/g.10184  ORF Transcript_3605/g.10184 Transcript_3605/m.10184 type:complete len:218 (-) Transcript_3605:108-761(-)|eukprot:QDZ25327.1 hypothetical protein A3770_16p78450 [Chloropicon primus]